MPAPTFIQEAETTWSKLVTPSTKTTGSFSVLAGDVLIAYGMTEDSAITLFSITGGSLTWNPIQASAVGNNVWQGLWTATVDSNKSMTVTVTQSTAFNVSFGVNVLTFRGSNGVGASNKDTGPNTPTLGLTTTQANSAIVVVNGDWNAGDGSTRSWVTSAGTFNEKTYDFQSTVATYYGGYHDDVGAAGAKTLGMSLPNTQTWTTMAVEVLGTAPPPGVSIAWLSV